MGSTPPARGVRAQSRIALTIALAILGVAALISSYSTASAAEISWQVDMVGSNEVPPATSNGYGLALFTFNTETRELDYEVRMFGLPLDQVTASHIHRAAPGVAGPPVFTLASAPFAVVSGTVTLSDADVADLRAGNLYVNIHSVANPAGFARGQMRLPGSAPGAPNTGDSFALTTDDGVAGTARVAGGSLVIVAAAMLVAVRVRGSRVGAR